MEDPAQPQGPIFEQALCLVWYELEIYGSTNQDELQCRLVSLRENLEQYKSIFGFIKGHDGALRGSVGKTSPEYGTRSPFFLLLPWGKPINKVTPMGSKNGRVPH